MIGHYLLSVPLIEKNAPFYEVIFNRVEARRICREAGGDFFFLMNLTCAVAT